MRNFIIINLYLNKEVVKKAVLHQVIRTANQKQLLMFLNWLGLLPQMQTFEHRLVERL